MVISLQNIVPQFLEKEKIERSEIWQHNHTFSANERIQIVAPSGSGKTSLVHFLYGIRNDYDGDIFIKDMLHKKMSSPLKIKSSTELASLREKTISIIFQDLRLFKEYSVIQNVEIKRNLHPYHSKSLINEMAERLGIASKLKQAAGICSYGEQQRIAIIRALQQPFDFIIMDEPFSHLDDNNSKLAFALIEEEAAKRDATIILADLEPSLFFEATTTLHL
jgi:ABC-type lipoprotein export system ATPase subunit